MPFSMLSATDQIMLTGLVFLLGLILGSALDCLAQRMVSGEKWGGTARSACPACHHVLSPLDLVPLLSWLCLGGKCRYCGAKVSIRYPLTEAGLGLIFVSLLLVSGIRIHTLSQMVLCACLLTLSLVDLDTQIIPDRFLIIPYLFRVGELLLTGQSLTALVPGVGMAAAVLALSLIMDKILKKDTMGGGDIKLLALLGAYLTFPQCLLMIMLACVIGIVIASALMKVDAETAFPFGPALSLAAWITLLVGQPIITWYLGLF